MPERFSGGYEYEPAPEREPVRAVELPELEHAPAARQALFDDVWQITATIEGTVGMRPRDAREPAVSTFAATSPHDALRRSFESVESRCFKLMFPMGASPQQFGYAAQGLLVDGGTEREQRYRLLETVLDPGELAGVRAADAALDGTGVLREHRYLLAYKLFHAYKQGLGRPYGADPARRPWDDPEFLVRLFPALSSASESGITPLLELTEIDDVEG